MQKLQLNQGLSKAAVYLIGLQRTVEKHQLLVYGPFLRLPKELAEHRIPAPMVARFLKVINPSGSPLKVLSDAVAGHEPARDKRFEILVRGVAGGQKLSRPGVGRVLYETGAAVVPCFHRGLDQVLPIGCVAPRIGKRVEIVIGPPFSVDDLRALPNTRETWQKIADRLMARIAELAPPAAGV